MILAQAGRFGGWSLYLKDGKPTYCYNFLGLQQCKVSAPHALAAGKATVRMNFDYDGGVGKGGTATLWSTETRSRADGSNAHRGRSSRAMRRQEWAGMTPRWSHRTTRNLITPSLGKILKVTVDVKPIGAAVKAEADTGKHEAAVKQALSN